MLIADGGPGPKNNALTRSKNGKLKMQIYWLIIFWDFKGHLKRSLYTMFIFEENMFD